MGYRSQVLLAVDKEIAPFFTAMLAQNPLAQALAQGAEKFASGYEEEGDWIVYWEDIKWYESYDDVGPFVKFVDALSSEDEDVFGSVENVHERWRFIRLGEDFDDCTSEGGGFWDIACIRSIEF